MVKQMIKEGFAKDLRIAAGAAMQVKQKT